MRLVFVLALALLNCGKSGRADSSYSNPFVFEAGNCRLQLDEATCTGVITALCCRKVMESYDLELYPSSSHEAAAQATCTDDRYLCIEPDPRGAEGDLLQEKEAHPHFKTIIFSTVASFMLAAIVISVMVTCYCRRREMRARRDEPGLGAPIQCTQDSPSRWTWNS